MSRTQIDSKHLRRIILIALFGALSYVLMLFVKIPVSFLTLDVKDTVITLAGLYFGPLAALSLSCIVSLVEMVTVSTTEVYGLIMNILGTAAFSVTASVIYKYKKDFFGALLGLLSGAAVMVSCMLLFNLIVTPLYMGVSVDEVKALIPVLFLPFNAVKGILNAAIVMMLYKPLSEVLKRAGVLPRSNHPFHMDLRTLIVTLVSLAVAIASVLYLIYEI